MTYFENCAEVLRPLCQEDMIFIKKTKKKNCIRLWGDSPTPTGSCPAVKVGTLVCDSYFSI